MKSGIVNRRDYRNAPQTELAAIAESVLNRTRENPEFAFLSESISELDSLLSQYQKALAAARNRGLLEISVKNEVREKLVAALDTMADLLEAQSEINETRVLDAGFRTNDITTRMIEAPPVPEVVKTQPTGKRGELKVQLKIRERANRMRLMHLCEYSDDQGQTWKNGLYKPSQRFVISGLPRLSTIQLRFRAIAPNGQTSEWSEAWPVAVN